jgi:HEAT repeat protein
VYSPLSHADPDQVTAGFDMMAKMAPLTPTADPLPELVRGLHGNSAVDRLQAAKGVARLGWLARDALPALVGVLADEDPKVREAAAHAVGVMGLEALPTLTGMLTHFDKYVRRQAVWALGRLGPLARPALPALCAALRDTDSRTATGAAQALGNMGSDGADAVPALAEAMRGTNIVLCRLAAKALSQIGTPALATLIAHLQHADPFVRGESAMAIGWMGAVARPAVPFLAQIVRGSRSSLTRTPSPALTPGPCSDDEIPFGLSDSSTLTPPQATSITEDRDSGEEACRVTAAQALGRIGPPAHAALSDLHDAVQFGPESLRQAAQHAIRQIQNKS